MGLKNLKLQKYLKTFMKDQQTIQTHREESFLFFTYYCFFSKIFNGVIVSLSITFLEKTLINEDFLLLCVIMFVYMLFVDYIITIYVIIYKNNPVAEVFSSVCYHTVTKGLPVFGMLHLSSNTPMILPNPVSNMYHMYSPVGRGYGIHSIQTLAELEHVKGNLGGRFNYKAVIDDKGFIDSKKLKAYMEKENIISLRNVLPKYFDKTT